MPASSITLPALPSPRWKYAAGVATALVAAPLYLLPNRMAATSAIVLPLTALDNAVPFLPWTGWIYAAVYVFLVAAFVALDDLAAASRFLYACLFAQLVAAACFVAWPIVYPRELFPLPQGTSTGDTALAAFWRALDAPANCFPSLHVSTTVLCVAAFAAGSLRRFVPLALIVAALLVASTLTFKQHYVVDIAGGLALGLGSWALFFRSRRFAVAIR